MVTLIMGEEDDEKHFTIHKNILCAASPFFKAACKPERMKPIDRVLELPEDDDEMIQLMIYWTYHNEWLSPTDVYSARIILATEVENTVGILGPAKRCRPKVPYASTSK
jgi:BTB/POZ domain